MAKTKEIHVSFSRTVSRDYQSMKFDVGETVIIEKDDNIEEVYNNKFAELKALVHANIKKVLSPQGKTE